jgi:DNA-directed RNA polymerase specialized sigma24 family protein
MSLIKVVSNAVAREISVQEPVVLNLSTIEDQVASLGEDLAVNMIKNQLKVSFRAVIRRKLEEKDDNGEFTNSDEVIAAEDYADWKPTLRITKTPEEKAMEALGALPPEVREAVLAAYNNAKNDEDAE